MRDFCRLEQFNGKLVITLNGERLPKQANLTINQDVDMAMDGICEVTVTLIAKCE